MRSAFILLLACACGDAGPRMVPADGGVLGTRVLGEPCVHGSDCASGLCIAVDDERAVCTSVCESDSACPSGANWACVRPAGAEFRACGCVPDAASEVCGDGRDNECNGRVDDCRICEGRPVAQDDPNHCGACGRQCRDDESCIGGECRCTDARATNCGACVRLEQSSSNCGSCGNACPVEQSCALGLCECPDDEPTLCDASCVDTQTDRLHCGACGGVCPPGQSCIGGACGCPPERPAYCDGACVDSLVDRRNCGSCGEVCPSAQACVGGTCQCGSAGETLCGLTCVDVGGSPEHCGACDNVCGAGFVCRGGSCECGSASAIPCGGTCVRPDNDLANCGACGNACAPGEICNGGSCSCSSGVFCGATCMPRGDDANCGGCGVSCGPTQSCNVSGACICATWWLSACGEACVDFERDEANCGGCGVTCRATETCSSGSCTCGSGREFCASVGMCVDVRGDESHCGACDNACNPVLSCINSSCRCLRSDETYCASVDACVSLRSDLEHCGACDRACNPTEICSSTCRCPTSGSRYCDSQNACTDTLSNDLHCGACDNACPTGASCASGRCVCDDADRFPCATGCANLLTSRRSCGRCDNNCGGGGVCLDGFCACRAPTAGTDVVLAAADRFAVGWNGTEVLLVYARNDRNVRTGQTLSSVRLDTLGNPLTPSIVLATQSRWGSSWYVPLGLSWRGSEWGLLYGHQGDDRDAADLWMQRLTSAGALSGTRWILDNDRPGRDPIFDEGFLLTTTDGWFAFSREMRGSTTQLWFRKTGTRASERGPSHALGVARINQDFDYAQAATGEVLVADVQFLSSWQSETHLNHIDAAGNPAGTVTLAEGEQHEVGGVFHDGTSFVGASWVRRMSTAVEFEGRRGDDLEVRAVTTQLDWAGRIFEGSAGLIMLESVPGVRRVRRVRSLPTRPYIEPVDATLEISGSGSNDRIVQTGPDSALLFYINTRELHVLPITFTNCR